MSTLTKQYEHFNDGGTESEGESDSEDESNSEGSGDESSEESDSEDSEDDTEDPNIETETQNDVADNSDENGERESCPVCLNRFVGQDLGTPENCGHTFCLECIMEWSKNINTCPIDRNEFNNVYVCSTPGGKVLKKVKVDVKPKEPEDALQEDVTVCEVCHSGAREDRLLLCDACDLAYHCECLDPPLFYIPIEEWFCPPCARVLRTGAMAGCSAPRSRRVIPRTRASETVRNRVQNMRTKVNRTSTSASSSKTRTKTPRPRKRRTYRRSYKKVVQLARTKKNLIDGGKGKACVKGSTVVVTYRRKSRRRRRRKIKKTKTSSAQSAYIKSAQDRIAKRLGLVKPHKGVSIPNIKQKASTSSVAVDNQMSVSLFGKKDELIDFSEKDEETPGPSKPSSSSTKSSNSSNRFRQIPQASTSSLNLLDSIMESQALLHSKPDKVVIKTDGTLTLKNDSSDKKTSNKNGTPKLSVSSSSKSFLSTAKNGAIPKTNILNSKSSSMTAPQFNRQSNSSNNHSAEFKSPLGVPHKNITKHSEKSLLHSALQKEAKNTNSNSAQYQKQTSSSQSNSDMLVKMSAAKKALWKNTFDNRGIDKPFRDPIPGESNKSQPVSKNKVSTSKAPLPIESNKSQTVSKNQALIPKTTLPSESNISQPLSKNQASTSKGPRRSESNKSQLLSKTQSSTPKNDMSVDNKNANISTNSVNQFSSDYVRNKRLAFYMQNMESSTQNVTYKCNDSDTPIAESERCKESLAKEGKLSKEIIEGELLEKSVSSNVASLPLNTFRAPEIVLSSDDEGIDLEASQSLLDSFAKSPNSGTQNMCNNAKCDSSKSNDLENSKCSENYSDFRKSQSLIEIASDSKYCEVNILNVKIKEEPISDHELDCMTAGRCNTNIRNLTASQLEHISAVHSKSTPLKTTSQEGNFVEEIKIKKEPHDTFDIRVKYKESSHSSCNIPRSDNNVPINTNFTKGPPCIKEEPVSSDEEITPEVIPIDELPATQLNPYLFPTEKSLHLQKNIPISITEHSKDVVDKSNNSLNNFQSSSAFKAPRRQSADKLTTMLCDTLVKKTESECLQKLSSDQVRNEILFNKMGTDVLVDASIEIPSNQLQSHPSSQTSDSSHHITKSMAIANCKLNSSAKECPPSQPRRTSISSGDSTIGASCDIHSSGDLSSLSVASSNNTQVADLTDVKPSANQFISLINNVDFLKQLSPSQILTLVTNLKNNLASHPPNVSNPKESDTLKIDPNAKKHLLRSADDEIGLGLPSRCETTQQAYADNENVLDLPETQPNLTYNNNPDNTDNEGMKNLLKMTSYPKETQNVTVTNDENIFVRPASNLKDADEEDMTNLPATQPAINFNNTNVNAEDDENMFDLPATQPAIHFNNANDYAKDEENMFDIPATQPAINFNSENVNTEDDQNMFDMPATQLIINHPDQTDSSSGTPNEDVPNLPLTQSKTTCLSANNLKDREKGGVVDLPATQPAITLKIQTVNAEVDKSINLPETQGSYPMPSTEYCHIKNFSDKSNIILALPATPNKNDITVNKSKHLLDQSTNKSLTYDSVCRTYVIIPSSKTASALPATPCTASNFKPPQLIKLSNIVRNEKRFKDEEKLSSCRPNKECIQLKSKDLDLPSTQPANMETISGTDVNKDSSSLSDNENSCNLPETQLAIDSKPSNKLKPPFKNVPKINEHLSQSTFISNSQDIFDLPETQPFVIDEDHYNKTVFNTKSQMCSENSKVILENENLCSSQSNDDDNEFEFPETQPFIVNENQINEYKSCPDTQTEVIHQRKVDLKENSFLSDSEDTFDLPATQPVSQLQMQSYIKKQNEVQTVSVKQKYLSNLNQIQNMDRGDYHYSSDDDNIPATQPVNTKRENLKSDTNKNLEDCKSVIESDDSIDLPATQLMTSNKPCLHHGNNISITKGKNNTSSSKNDLLICTENNCISSNNVSSAFSLENNLPTIQSVPFGISQGVKELQNEASVNLPSNNISEDLPSTQPVSIHLKEKDLSSISKLAPPLLQTSSLEEDIFDLPPTQPISFDLKEKDLSSSSMMPPPLLQTSSVEEDIFNLPPTQPTFNKKSFNQNKPGLQTNQDIGNQAAQKLSLVKNLVSHTKMRSVSNITPTWLEKTDEVSLRKKSLKIIEANYLENEDSFDLPATQPAIVNSSKEDIAEKDLNQNMSLDCSKNSSSSIDKKRSVGASDLPSKSSKQLFKVPEIRHSKTNHNSVPRGENEKDSYKCDELFDLPETQPLELSLQDNTLDCNIPEQMPLGKPKNLSELLVNDHSFKSDSQSEENMLDELPPTQPALNNNGVFSKMDVGSKTGVNEEDLKNIEASPLIARNQEPEKQSPKKIGIHRNLPQVIVSKPSRFTPAPKPLSRKTFSFNLVPIQCDSFHDERIMQSNVACDNILQVNNQLTQKSVEYLNKLKNSQNVNFSHTNNEKQLCNSDSLASSTVDNEFTTEQKSRTLQKQHLSETKSKHISSSSILDKGRQMQNVSKPEKNEKQRSGGLLNSKENSLNDKNVKASHNKNEEKCASEHILRENGKCEQIKRRESVDSLKVLKGNGKDKSVNGNVRNERRESIELLKKNDKGKPVNGDNVKIERRESIDSLKDKRKNDLDKNVKEKTVNCDKRKEKQASVDLLKNQNSLKDLEKNDNQNYRSDDRKRKERQASIDQLKDKKDSKRNGKEKYVGDDILLNKNRSEIVVEDRRNKKQLSIRSVETNRNLSKDRSANKKIIYDIPVKKVQEKENRKHSTDSFVSNSSYSDSQDVERTCSNEEKISNNTAHNENKKRIHAESKYETNKVRETNNRSKSRERDRDSSYKSANKKIISDGPIKNVQEKGKKRHSTDSFVSNSSYSDFQDVERTCSNNKEKISHNTVHNENKKRIHAESKYETNKVRETNNRAKSRERDQDSNYKSANKKNISDGPVKNVQEKEKRRQSTDSFRSNSSYCDSQYGEKTSSSDKEKISKNKSHAENRSQIHDESKYKRKKVPETNNTSKNKESNRESSYKSADKKIICDGPVKNVQKKEKRIHSTDSFISNSSCDSQGSERTHSNDRVKISKNKAYNENKRQIKEEIKYEKKKVPETNNTSKNSNRDSSYKSSNKKIISGGPVKNVQEKEKRRRSADSFMSNSSYCDSQDDEKTCNSVRVKFSENKTHNENKRQIHDESKSEKRKVPETNNTSKSKASDRDSSYQKSTHSKNIQKSTRKEKHNKEDSTDSTSERYSKKCNEKYNSPKKNNKEHRCDKHNKKYHNETSSYESKTLQGKHERKRKLDKHAVKEHQESKDDIKIKVNILKKENIKTESCSDNKRKRKNEAASEKSHVENVKKLVKKEKQDDYLDFSEIGKQIKEEIIGTSDTSNSYPMFSDSSMDVLIHPSQIKREPLDESEFNFEEGFEHIAVREPWSDIPPNCKVKALKVSPSKRKATSDISCDFETKKKCFESSSSPSDFGSAIVVDEQLLHKFPKKTKVSNQTSKKIKSKRNVLDVLNKAADDIIKNSTYKVTHESLSINGRFEFEVVKDSPSCSISPEPKERKIDKKKDLKEEIAEEVKRVLKPFYSVGVINKDDYKDIMRRSVPKIFTNCSNIVNPEKIKKLILNYVSMLKNT